MPILKRNCLACHHQKEAEGGLVLESAESIHVGGDGGSGVNIEEPLSSPLLTRATGEEEPLMPPEDNSVGASPLSPDELGLLKLWIEQGAKGSTTMSESIQWQAIPESVRTSLAMAVSPDGQFAAVGRGNRVIVVNLATYEPKEHLIDPEVLGENASHVDLVQSIAISPDAQRIATGGFRTVKIWKKESLPVDQATTPLTRSAGLLALKSNESTAAIVNAIGDLEVWNLATSERTHVLPSHGDQISGLAWAAAVDRLVSCDSSGRVIVWQPDTGLKACELQTNASLADLAISHDGQQIAAIDITGKLHRMRIHSEGTAIESLPQMPEVVSKATDVLFASKPNATLIVSDESAGVLIVSLSDDQIVRKIEHGAVVNSLAISADETHLLTGGRDGKTRVWDLATGEPVRTLEGEAQGSLQLVYAQREAQRQRSAVERLTAETAELEKRLTNEKEVLSKATEEQEKAAKALEENEKKRVDAFTVVASTEQTIAKANQDATQANAAIEAAKEKLAATGTLMQSIKGDLEGKTIELANARGEVDKVKAQIAEMMKLLEDAEARSQQIQKVVDEKNSALAQAKASLTAAHQEIDSATKRSADSKATSEKATKELEQQKKNLASVLEAKQKSETELAKRQQALDTAAQAHRRAEAAIPTHQAVIASETRRQALLDQRLGEVQQRMNDPDQQVIGISVSPDSRLTATLHQDGSVRVYRVDDGKSIASLNAPTTGLPNQASHVTWQGDDVIAYGAGCSPKVWSTEYHWTLERSIGSIDDPTVISDRVTAMDFRQDGMSIAVGSGPPSRSGEVKVFAVANGHLVRDFGEVHSDTVLGLSFSPDGRTIASSAADKTIRLLDVATGDVTRSLEGHTHHVLSIAWQDDGLSLASASADRTVKVWDAETGEQRRTISGFGKEITAITFVSATNQLATACADGQVRLYDVSNGKTIRNFNANGDFLFTLDVSLDGKTLLAAGQSGVLRVWNVEDGKVLHELK